MFPYSFKEETMTGLITAAFVFPWVLILAVVLFVVVCMLVINDWVTTPLVLALIILLLHDYYADAPTIMSTLRENWLYVLGIAVVWVPVGVTYTFYRWTMFCKDAWHRWQQYGGEVSTKSSFMPEASAHQARIFGWILYWPISGAWYLLHDFLTHLVTVIYERIAGRLDAISRRIFESN